jgi:hypothetical protein
MIKRPPEILALSLSFLGVLLLLYSMDVLSRNIGFYWDEIWDYVPSVAMIRGDSLYFHQEISLFHHPVPLVTGPYQGALKTWVVAPLLKLFGGSPHFILTLNVLFALVYMLALYWALLPVIGRWAWVVFAWPCLDTNFLLFAPMDFGPSLFQCIFISLAMGALFRYLVDRDMAYYRLIWFFTGCTLAQKLTALPVVISLMSITIAFAGRSFWKSIDRHRWRRTLMSYAITPALMFLIPMIPHLVYFARSGFADLFAMTAEGVRRPYFSSLADNFKYYHTIFDGVDWAHRITLDYSAPIETSPILFFCVFALVVVSLIIYFASGRDKKNSIHAVTSFGLIVLGFLIYPLFGGLGRPWHYFILTPIFACCLILSTAACLSYLESRWPKFAAHFRSIFALCLALGIAAGAAHGLKVLHYIENKKGSCFTSPAINDVYRALRAANIRMVYGVNYSIAYPIYVLSKGTISVEEMAWTDLTKEKTEELLNRARENTETAVIYRFCACKEWEQNSLNWLNRDPQIFEFINKVDSERFTLDIKNFEDKRETKFVLIRRAQQ